MRSLRRPFAVYLGVLAVLGLSLALAATAGAKNPAVDEYVLDIPEATGSSTGNGNGSSSGNGNQSGGGGDGGSSSSSGDSSEAEPAPPPATAPEPSTPNPSPQESGGTNSSASNAGGGGGEKADQPRPNQGSDGPNVGAVAASSAAPAAQTVPAIATDVAGEGGVPLLLAGLAGVGALGLFFVHRRRQAQRG